MFLQQCRELVVAHFFHLFALIGMVLGPEVDPLGADLLDLADDLGQGQLAIHAGSQCIMQTEPGWLGGFQGTGKTGGSGSGGEEPAHLAAIDVGIGHKHGSAKGRLLEGLRCLAAYSSRG